AGPGGGERALLALALAVDVGEPDPDEVAGGLLVPRHADAVGSERRERRHVDDARETVVVRRAVEARRPLDVRLPLLADPSRAVAPQRGAVDERVDAAAGLPHALLVEEVAFDDFGARRLDPRARPARPHERADVLASRPQGGDDVRSEEPRGAGD